MRHIKKRMRVILPTLMLLLLLGTQSIVPAAAFACGSSTGSSTAQVLNGVDQTGTDCSGSGVSSAISAAVTILSIVIGAAAIIMILVSGFRYMTSGGDSAKISGAKSALIYALVGLAVAALAQFLVHFVLYQATNATTPPAATAPKKP
jgi:hypothetical protein